LDLVTRAIGGERNVDNHSSQRLEIFCTQHYPERAAPELG